MRKFSTIALSLQMGFVAAIPVALSLALLTSVRSGAFGQASQNSAIASAQSAPSTETPSVLTGSGDQMRAIAAVCEAWEKAHKKPGHVGSRANPAAIRDYTFRLTDEGAVYKVTLWPRKPVVKKIATPKGVYLQNDSATFFYEVRRSDFKIVGVSAIM